MVIADLSVAGVGRRCSVQVAFLSDYSEATVKNAAFEAGAAGYVRKIEISNQLLFAVNEVLAGRRYVPADATRPNKKDQAD
jgi:DNA-binding NarL/FixJ family response regulator